MRKTANRPPNRGDRRLDSARPSAHSGRMREDWQRLANWVVSRRDQLGMTTQGALSQESGASLRQIGEVENGRRVGPKTLARIERGLQWEPGSAREVLRGGRPTVTELDVESEPVLHNDTERAIWALDRVASRQRWAWIQELREMENGAQTG